MAVVVLNVPLWTQYYNIISNIKVISLVEQAIYMQTNVSNLNKTTYRTHLTPDASPQFSCLGDE